MKICFISPKIYPVLNQDIKSIFGGAEVQLFLLSSEIAKKDEYEVSCIAADYGQNDEEIRQGVKIFKAFKLTDSLPLKIFKFFRSLNKAASDVYIQRTMTPFSFWIALHCKIIGRKFIYMLAHDREVGIFYARLVFFVADRIIVQNSYQHNKIGRKAFFLNSSCHIKEFIPDRCGDFVLFVGRSKGWKQPDLFMDLAIAFPREKFVMICPAATDEYDFFSRLKKRSADIKNLEFIDFIPYNEVDNFFSRAKIFVNTSLQEGFPNTFMDAGKNGVPIISLNIDPNDIFNKYKVGIFCDNDFEKMKSAVGRLLSNPEDYKVFSRGVYDYVCTHHNISTNTDKLLEIIK